jgi:hypothetical protein
MHRDACDNDSMKRLQFESVPRSLVNHFQVTAKDAGVSFVGDRGEASVQGTTIRYDYQEQNETLVVETEGWFEGFAAEEINRRYLKAREEWEKSNS